ncbi:hypothetical protein WN943_001805 [Citrus x changshan-huyou]
MHTYRPLREYKVAMPKPFNKTNASTTLDPTKHSVVTLEQIPSSSTQNVFATTPNPLFLGQGGIYEKLDGQPMGDPADMKAWDMDNLTDDPEDSDYVGDSGDEESEDSEVAEPPVCERDLGDIERDDLRRQVEHLQQRLQHLEGTREAAPNGSSEEEGSINDGVDYNPFHQEQSSNSEFSSRSRIHRRRDSYQPFDFKVEIPEFEERMQPEEFVDWLNTFECIFEYRDVPEDRKVKLIAIKLKKYASLWWENLKRQREREGRRKIVTWEKMKKELKRKFLPDNYRQDIYLKFHNFRQKELSVEDYTAEFNNLMMKCDLVEAANTVWTTMPIIKTKFIWN